MRNHLKIKISQILICLTILVWGKAFTSLQAQDGKTPKVGLVLSGGGAKGFAHIGTLKVIDSLGIKVDYIAGTSMGSIIGALYAAGYSGKQLDSIFKSLDFDALINDKFPRASKSFYERDNAEKYLTSLPFDKFKISLPSGLSRGQNVYDLLYRLLLPVSDLNDFEDLPTPFFCIATNIETGEPVLLDEGNLAEAILASGAFPSLFQPVMIDDKLLIDGGVTNNYPVEELRAKGMDIIIGVDVQDGLKDRTDLKTAPDILMQINNFRTINAMKNKKQLTDIYIKPDITSFSVISFDEGVDIINEGEKAAILRIEDLKTLKSKLNTKREHPKIVIPDSIRIREVLFNGNKRYTRSYLKGKLKYRGEKYMPYSAFKKGINNVITTNNFDAFRYELEPLEEADTYRMIADVKESETSTFLKLGVHYDALYKSAALVNITKKRLLYKNDIASLDVVLGDNIRYKFDYFLDKGFYISIGVMSRYNQFERNINAALVLEDDNPLLNNINKLGVELQDQTNRIYLQTLLAKDFALSLGGEHKRLKITSEILLSENQEDDIVFENTDYFSLYGTLLLDTYDNRYFPNKGFYVNSDFHWYIGASDFNSNFNNFSIAKADLGYAFSIGNKVSVNLQPSGGFQLGSRATNFLNFAIGGYGHNFINNFSSFLGYDYISLTGNSFVKAVTTLDYEPFNKHHLLFTANYANIEDDIFDNGEWLSSPDYSGYGIGYAFETFLGPIEAKYTWSPENSKGFWYFNIGFWF